MLRLARGGVVFAPGWAGTVQEVFQAATKAFYRTDGDGGPLVFLDRAVLDRHGAGRHLARAVARGVAHGDLRRLIHITDEVVDAVAVLTDG